jgi:hypothetical protein
LPAFSDGLALVRRELWCDRIRFSSSQCDTEMVNIRRILIERLAEAVCYAA